MPDRNIIQSFFVLVIMTMILLVSCSAEAEKIKVDKDVIGTQALCPVTGDMFTITESTPVIQYKGVKYSMCCPGCDTEFMKDPEKYIEKMHQNKPAKTDLEEDVIGKEAVCLVTGDTFTIHESTPVVEYEGKKYYFCCPGCDTEFLKDPEKYIKNEPEKEKQSISPDKSSGEILYWTCSMHPEVRSDQEGNCPICGMNLIPVREQTTPESGGALHLSERDMELAGIRMMPTTYLHVHRKIEAVGRVAYDPELVIAQEEYVNALDMMSGLAGSDDVTVARLKKVVGNAEYKLRLLGMDEAEIRKLKSTKRVDRSLVLPEHETWVYVDVYESDIAWIKKGQDVTITSVAYPGEEFHGKIRSVNPTLNSRTRSVQVRVQLSNPHMKLRPGMYVDAKISAQYVAPPPVRQRQKAGNKVLAIPRESVLDTGNRTVVWLYVGDGNFQARQVLLGPLGVVRDGKRSTYYYPVLDGLKENEVVVTNGNFLIDSESQITGVAALGYGGALGVSPR